MHIDRLESIRAIQDGECPLPEASDHLKEVWDFIDNLSDSDDEENWFLMMSVRTANSVGFVHVTAIARRYWRSSVVRCWSASSKLGMKLPRKMIDNP